MDGIEGVYDEEWLLGDRDSSVLFFVSTSYLSSLGDAVLTEAPRPCSRIAERMYGADEFDILSVFAFGMFVYISIRLCYARPSTAPVIVTAEPVSVVEQKV
jgi:hypothetical protein